MIQGRERSEPDWYEKELQLDLNYETQSMAYYLLEKIKTVQRPIRYVRSTTPSSQSGYDRLQKARVVYHHPGVLAILYVIRTSS